MKNIVKVTNAIKQKVAVTSPKACLHSADSARDEELSR